MDQSLSIIVPVHNAQAQLADQIGDMLEILPELAIDFEVMIVDDASTDQTEEVAVDLARQFPQVQVARHAQRKGLAAAVKTGLLGTTSDVVFVCDERTRLSLNGLRELWKLRDDQNLVMAKTEYQPRALDAGLIHRLMVWGKALQKIASSGESPGGIQMIRRCAVEQLSYLDSAERQLTIERIARTDVVKSGRAKQKPPNFFARLTNFAIGE